jgi:hypothetical protein
MLRARHSPSAVSVHVVLQFPTIRQVLRHYGATHYTFASQEFQVVVKGHDDQQICREKLRRIGTGRPRLG